jgi:hypothetical protein
MLLLAPWLGACLERITENPPPLDPGFYRADEGAANDAAGNETLRPFAGYKGEWVKVRGEILSDQVLPVDMDLWTAKPDDPGKREHLGKILLAVPGPFEIDVPRSQGWLMIEGCHDFTGDGPSDDDAFGQILVEVGATDMEGVTVKLALGTRGQATAAGGGGLKPFAGYEGEKVWIRGSVEGGRELSVALDFWVVKPDSPGTRTHAGKLELASPGAFEVQAPRDQGPLVLEATQDLGGDGPTDDDAYGQATLEIHADDLDGVLLTLAEGGRALATSGRGGAPRPFADHNGEWVALRGRIEGSPDWSVGVDLWKSQTDAPGNRAHLGKPATASPGPFEIQVPRGFGPLQIEVLRDLAGDGPSDEDPYGQIAVEVGDSDLEGLVIQLDPAGRGRPAGGQGGAAHVEMPPGAPGGSPIQGGNVPVGPAGEAWKTHDPFAAMEGPRVRIRGVVEHEPADAVVDFDFFQSDPKGPGGRSFVGKAKRQPGPFEFNLPLSLTQVSLEIFVDTAGDGPTPGDPFTTCLCNPIVLSNGNLDGIVIKF